MSNSTPPILQWCLDAAKEIFVLASVFEGVRADELAAIIARHAPQDSALAEALNEALSVLEIIQEDCRKHKDADERIAPMLANVIPSGNAVLKAYNSAVPQKP